MDIQVECYAGYRADETPRAIRFAKRRIEVLKVVDRWLSPYHRYFKVLGDDNGIYIIRHDLTDHRWELHYYEDSGSQQ